MLRRLVSVNGHQDDEKHQMRFSVASVLIALCVRTVTLSCRMLISPRNWRKSLDFSTKSD